MTPTWAPREEDGLRYCIVSPTVFPQMVDRLGDVVVPYYHALEAETGGRHVHRPLQGLLSHVDRKNEVKALGALENSARTPEQTDLAYFFADNSFLYWNRAIQGIASTYLDNIGDSARLFALVNMAMADGAITAWDMLPRLD